VTEVCALLTRLPAILLSRVEENYRGRTRSPGFLGCRETRDLQSIPVLGPFVSPNPHGQNEDLIYSREKASRGAPLVAMDDVRSFLSRFDTSRPESSS